MNAKLHLTFRQWADAVDHNELQSIRAIEDMVNAKLTEYRTELDKCSIYLLSYGRCVTIMTDDSFYAVPPEDYYI